MFLYKLFTMIRKTEFERKLIKQKKKEWKQINKDRKLVNLFDIKEENDVVEDKKNPILTGILPDEIPLDDDVPVYGNFLYVIDDVNDNGTRGKVIMSDLHDATIRDLRKDLKAKGYEANTIRTCRKFARNLK